MPPQGTPPERGTQRAELQTRYDTAMREVGQRTFAMPKTPQQEYADDYWERVQNMPGFSPEKKRVLLAMKQTADRYFEATIRLLEQKAITVEETDARLNALAHTLEGVAQAIKMQSNPYAVEGQVRRPSEDVLDPTELVTLRRFVEEMAKLNSEELIALVLEDQAYIQMLVDLGSGEPPKLDTPEQIEAYRHNLRHMRRFILGVPEGDGQPGREKSESRKVAEVSLWIEIVRSMSLTEKRNLVAIFLEDGTVKETEDFVSVCIIGGVMTREEAMHMYGEEEFARKLGKDFPKTLDQALEARKQAQAEMGNAVDRVTHVHVQNFANHFVTFNNLVLGRVAELGVLTAGLNLVLDVADRIGRRKEAGRNESIPKALALGCRDALTNGRLWFGVAEVGIGIEGIFPGMWERMINAPSGEEKEAVARTSQEKYLRDELRAHPAMDEHFLDHYDKYLAMANPNKNPKCKNGEPRKSFDLYPGDVEMTDEQAGKLGYHNAAAAIAAIHELFTICANGLKHENAMKLERYLAENVWEAPDRHKHA